jgi:hypothetical protein
MADIRAVAAHAQGQGNARFDPAFATGRYRDPTPAGTPELPFAVGQPS